MQPVAAGADVKDIWEFSRLDWLLCMAQRAAKGDAAEAGRLNEWITDWAAKNPPFRGRNWQCGQEAAIRVIHLMAAALLLQEADRPEEPLLDLVEVHLRRIMPTVGYAMSQRNNHSALEAAALFMGGAWLASHRRGHESRYESAGRHLLEWTVLGCTCDDGALSQYSTNYQRMFLDAMSMAEFWRTKLGRRQFKCDVRGRIGSSIRWLDAIVDRESGDAPNLGGNDGAMLLPIGPARYRNFRPSLHLAGALFGQPIQTPEDNASRSLLAWLGVEEMALPAASGSALLPAGGLAVATGKDFLALLRLPVFRFRPAHADALHVDLWIRGVNVVSDSGTFRYGGPNGTGDWFPSTAAHSTIEFDGRSQMPRLGRFLFGAWLRGEEVEFHEQAPGIGGAGASYRDAWGAKHRRVLRWSPGQIMVVDSVSGFRRSATLRWHLAPLDWQVAGNSADAGGIRISVELDGMPANLRMGLSARSLHYARQADAPMIETAAQAPSTFVTRIEWKQ